jgi:formylglycine-generating enzyme required for sulfatase activity/outer membrane protein assembly factor BamB
MKVLGLKRLPVLLFIAVHCGTVWLAGAQESSPPRPERYFDEPAWVHDRPPKLADRIWHAKPAPAGVTAQPLKGVRVVDYGDEVVRRCDQDKAGIQTFGMFGRRRGMNMLRGVDVDGSGRKNGRIQYREFSMDVPFSGRPPAYDIEANSAVFYGGAVVFLAGEKGGEFEEFGLNVVEGKNWTFIVHDSAIRSRMYGMVLWKKEDFRYGGDESRVSFDETSRIGLHVMRFFWRMEDIRYVVQDGEQLYISEYNCGTVEAQQLHDGKGDPDNPTAVGLSRHTVATGGGLVLGMSPNESRWARYDPKPPYHIDFAQDKAKYEKHTFNDVRAVGFYISKHTWEPKAMAIKWYGFEVLGTVHRKPRPSETLDTAFVSGGKDAEGKAIPAFYISKCEIPYALFHRVRRWAVAPQYVFDEFYPYVTINDGDMGSMDYGPGGRLKQHTSEEPVTDLTWLDAMLWCNMLSEYEGREPVYYVTADFRFVQRRACVRRWNRGGGDSRNDMYRANVYVKWDADGYRLPTSAEWLAATDASAPQPASAWIGSNAVGTTHDVATRAPNALGIYDMLGNVWEYVWDVGEKYDPTPKDFKAEHTVLGGGFNYPADPWKKLANPYGDEPHKGHFNIGFRLVRRDKGLPAPSLVVDVPKGVPSWTIEQGRKSKGKKLKVESNVLDMVECPEGSYIRKDTAKIFVSDSYFAKTEVTYAQWKKVRDWGVAAGYRFNYDGDMGSMDYQTWKKHRHGPDEPVTGVSRYDVHVWCNALSEMEGRKPCYYGNAAKTGVIRAARHIRAHWSRRSRLFDAPELHILGWQPGMSSEMGYMKGPKGTFDTYGLANFKRLYGGGFTPREFGTKAHVDWSADGYRLPTLAERTIATRAGTKTRHYWGDEPDVAGKHVWSWHNSEGRTQPVGVKPTNPLGLHDMLGNVFELCWAGANTKKKQAAHENWNPKGSMVGTRTANGYLMQGGSFLQSTITRSSSHAFLTGADNPKQAWTPFATCWNWNAFTYVGFRPVRCKRGTHRKSGSEMPEDIQILDVNLKLPVTPLQGQTHRGNLQRTGLFYSKGIRKQPRVKWRVKPGGKIMSCPLVHRDKVYVGTDAGIFHALDTETGDEKWRFKMAGGPVASVGKGFWGNVYPSAPTIKDGILYTGSAGGFLYALDIGTGHAKWSTTVYGAKLVPGSPLPAYGAVFTFINGYGKDSGLMAVHGETGQVLTVYRGIRGGKASMSFSDGRLLVGQKLVDMRSGFSKGGANEGGSWTGNSTTAMFNGRMYCVGDWEGRASSVKGSDFRSGQKLFDVPIEPGDSKAVRNGTADNTLSFWNDRLFFGTRQGNMYCCEAMRGRRLWKTKLSAQTRCAPAVSTVSNAAEQAVVYIGCDDGNLWALDAVSGEKLWGFKTGGIVWLDPWVAEGVVYVASDDGYLYALE